MNPRTFCNLVYHYLSRNADEKGRKDLDEQLYAALGGVDETEKLLAAINAMASKEP